MRRERHKIMILAKKRNNRELRNRIILNSQTHLFVKSIFGCYREFTLNPDE